MTPAHHCRAFINGLEARRIVFVLHMGVKEDILSGVGLFGLLRTPVTKIRFRLGSS